MALDRIVAHKRRSVDRLRDDESSELSVEGLSPSQRSLPAAIESAEGGFILECKSASPSCGELSESYDAVELARSYTPFADAVSVLADGRFFDGSPTDVRAVSEVVDVPVLWKDVVVDPIQIARARAFGADAILLMLSVLDDRLLGACLEVARRLSMDALVEVHDRNEVRRALDHPARPQLLGINNRDLETLEVSLEVTPGLAEDVPADRLVVAESGVGTRRDVLDLAPYCDAYLVGTAVAGADRPARAVRQLLFGDVKVCGLARPEDATCAYRAGATWGGLIFAADSPRHVTPDGAAAVAESVPLRWVGVFVERAKSEILRIVRRLELDAVQLHGDYTDAFAGTLRTRLDESVEIWGVEHIDIVDGSVSPSVEPGGDSVYDRRLLDTEVGGNSGGTGRTFDWEALDAVGSLERLVLAGGLEPANIAEAEDLGPGILDVNSGVERSPGDKSPEALEMLFRRLRSRTARRRRR